MIKLIRGLYMKRKISLKIFSIPSFVILFFHILAMVGICLFINELGLDAIGKTSLYVLSFIGLIFNLIPLIFCIIGSLTRIRKMYIIGLGISYIIGVFVLFYFFFILFLPFTDTAVTNENLSYIVATIFIVCFIFSLICMVLSAVSSFTAGRRNSTYMFMRISAILSIVFFSGFLIGGVAWINIHDGYSFAGLILCVIFLGLAYLVMLASSILYSCFEITTGKEETASLLNKSTAENASISNNEKEIVQYCPNCGTKIAKDARFCHKCGKEVSNSSN